MHGTRASFRFARGPYRPRDRRVDDDDAYLNLMAEVAMTAIKDYITGAPSYDGKAKLLESGMFTTQDYLFMDDEDRTRYVFSFTNVCRIFGVPVDKARVAIREQKRMKEAGIKPSILERRKVDDDF